MNEVIERDGDDSKKRTLAGVHDDVEDVSSACHKPEEDADQGSSWDFHKWNQLIGEAGAMLDCITQQDKSRDPIEKGLVDEKDERWNQFSHAILLCEEGFQQVP